MVEFGAACAGTGPSCESEEACQADLSHREWEWEAMEAAALEAYGAARTEEACHLWHRARELAATLPPDDPRRAASVSNAGLALLIDGQIPEADAAFEEAAELWECGLAWVDSMEITLGARSSLFHFRMEQRHGASYTMVRRSWNRNLLKGSAALTKFNQALVCYHLNRDTRADDLLRQSIELRRSACGTREAYLATMTAVYAARMDALGQLEDAEANTSEALRILGQPLKMPLELWIAERPSKLCDQRRLLAAAHLTASVHERDVMPA